MKTYTSKESIETAYDSLVKLKRQMTFERDVIRGQGGSVQDMNRIIFHTVGLLHQMKKTLDEAQGEG